MPYYYTPNGIPYEELQGSPTFSANESGITATQVVRVDWANLGLFIDECHPRPVVTSAGVNVTPNPKIFPGYPWLFAQSLEAEPFDENDPATMGVFFNQYNRLGARVTVQYAAKQLTPHRVSIGGEVIKLPNSSYGWSVPSLSSWTPVQDEDVMIGKIVPTMEHTFTFRNVINPPWTAIAERIGSLNLGSEIDDGVTAHPVNAGTLLFLGCDAEEERDTAGGSRWHLTYRFSERVLYDGSTRLTWNFFFDKDSSTWKKLITSAGETVFDQKEFDSLFHEDGWVAP